MTGNKLINAARGDRVEMSIFQICPPAETERPRCGVVAESKPSEFAASAGREVSSARRAFHAVRRDLARVETV
jgi:hypothetical protein